jgi:hypothetical protein
MPPSSCVLLLLTSSSLSTLSVLLTLPRAATVPYTAATQQLHKAAAFGAKSSSMRVLLGKTAAIATLWEQLM